MLWLNWWTWLATLELSHCLFVLPVQFGPLVIFLFGHSTENCTVCNWFWTLCLISGGQNLLALWDAEKGCWSLWSFVSYLDLLLFQNATYFLWHAPVHTAALQSHWVLANYDGDGDRTTPNKRFNEQIEQWLCTCVLNLVHFFAVLRKTTTWNNQVLCILENANHNGYLLVSSFEIKRIRSMLSLSRFLDR